jgi:hypothetical protein
MTIPVGLAIQSLLNDFERKKVDPFPYFPPIQIEKAGRSALTWPLPCGGNRRNAINTPLKGGVRFEVTRANNQNPAGQCTNSDGIGPDRRFPLPHLTSGTGQVLNRPRYA